MRKKIYAFLRIAFKGIILSYTIVILILTSGLDIKDYKYTLEPKYDLIYPYMDDIARVALDGLYGFVNKDTELIPPQYEDASYFSHGLAPVKLNDLYGYINIDNEWVIPPTYDHASAFHERGLGLVSRDGLYGLIDTKGLEVLAIEYETIEVCKQAIIYESHNQFGFITDKTYPAHYDSMSIFSEGLAAVKEGDFFGYVDLEDNMIIAPQFQEANPFKGDHAKVMVGDMYGVIDKEGQVIIDFIYDDIILFDELIGIKIGYNWGYMSLDGRVIIEPAYDKIFDFKNGLARVERNKKQGFIDSSNTYVIQPIFRQMTDFSQGYSTVKMNIFYGFVNDKGQYIIEPIFENASPFFENNTAFVKTKKWGIIKRNYRTYYYLKVITPTLILLTLYYLIFFLKKRKNLLK